MTQQAIGNAGRLYRPLLDELHRACDQELGSTLMWMPRQETALGTTAEGRQVVRVGPDFAQGVPTAGINREALTRAVNRVLAAHDFPEQPTITGSPTGELVLTSTDGDGSVLWLYVKETVEYWVDAPVREAW